MPIVIPDTHQDLLTDPIYASLVTLMPDGSSQASVVWRLWEPPYVLISSHANSQKTRNVQREPRITLLMVDPQNPFRYLEVRGVVEQIQPDLDYSVIDRITSLYLNKPYYGGAEPIEDTGKVPHVYFRILPQRVNVIGYRQLV